jgi:hypothetical protein
MRDLDNSQVDVGEPTGGEVKLACEHMVRELLDGVRHGFFEMSVTVETVQSKKKYITIKAGKSHRFIA